MNFRERKNRFHRNKCWPNILSVSKVENAVEDHLVQFGGYATFGEPDLI